MRRKEKISITLCPVAMRKVKRTREAYGLNRSAAINMLIMKRKRR